MTSEETALAIEMHDAARATLSPLVSSGAYDRDRRVHILLENTPSRIALLDVLRYGDSLSLEYAASVTATVDRARDLARSHELSEADRSALRHGVDAYRELADAVLRLQAAQHQK